MDYQARLTRAPATRNTVRVRQHLEMLIGLIGFFTLALFVTTVVAELAGKPALGQALVLLMSCLLLWAVIRYRRRF